MAAILTVSSNIKCPHGGLVLLTSSNRNLFANGMQILIESDIHMVAPGTCPFFVGSKYSPCVKVEWSGGSRNSKMSGIPLLTSNSLGKCLNSEGAVQGFANIIDTQRNVLTDG
jgi:hypothetical protein